MEARRVRLVKKIPRIGSSSHRTKCMIRTDDDHIRKVITAPKCRNKCTSQLKMSWIKVITTLILLACLHCYADASALNLITMRTRPHCNTYPCGRVRISAALNADASGLCNFFSFYLWYCNCFLSGRVRIDSVSNASDSRVNSCYNFSETI